MGKLIVHNFGPIKDIELNTNKSIYMIGESASGKSTIAKLISFFTGIFAINTIYQIQTQCGSDGEGMEKILRMNFCRIMGDITRKYNYRIEYRFSETETITCTHPLNESNDDMSLPTIYLSQALRNKITTILKTKTDLHLLYIPANRSIMTLLINGMVGQENLDPSIIPFLNTVIWHKNNFNEPIPTLIKKRKLNLLPNETFDEETLMKVAELSDKIMKGKLLYVNKEPRIFFDNNDSVALKYSSSGQQESIWIIQIILVSIYNNWKTTLVIEEPESHLHPVAQFYLMQIIQIFANIPDNKVIITTHSPYILSCLNNLLYAHHVGQKKTVEVDKIIAKESWADTRQLDTYLIENGKAEDIKDNELCMIKAELLDGISDTINDQYNQLLELDNDEQR